MATTRAKAAPPSTPLQSRAGNARSPAAISAASGKKAKAKPNASILSFFKKTDAPGFPEASLFIAGNTGRYTSAAAAAVGKRQDAEQEEEEVFNWVDVKGENVEVETRVEGEGEERYNEESGSVKRRRVDRDGSEGEVNGHTNDAEVEAGPAEPQTEAPKRYTGPFRDESDSEDEVESKFRRPVMKSFAKPEDLEDEPLAKPEPAENITADLDAIPLEASESMVRPSLTREATSYDGAIDEDDFDEYEEGEEFLERRYMEEQRRLELAEDGIFEDDAEDLRFEDTLPESDVVKTEEPSLHNADAPSCPICSKQLVGMSEGQVSVHVNGCLDGTPPSEPPVPDAKLVTAAAPAPKTNASSYKLIPRPGQANPFAAAKAPKDDSVFSRLMSGHAEDRAWAAAAAEEHASRGKPAYKRTCPFYKIMPGFSTCVDAFRYGAVEGCNAYFLSHFHSDHYIGLTASWSHGPIYCSHVTANLVRQQLRVDPKYVVDLEFEVTSEVPGTGGMKVTMIPANHCPGSSLFLFEKAMGKGSNPYTRRVLHCGDFRACRAHIEHPLLRPDVKDIVTGKNKLQKLDVCYLDTTYLNPRYAFPAQEDVMSACAERCVTFDRELIDNEDGWHSKGSSAGEMAKFLEKGNATTTDEQTDTEPRDSKDDPTRPLAGRLLVIVGTYSIGKERICLAIARALKSKIYATAYKQRICSCLEDPELNSLLTSDPRAAQVHMTPLGEIRPDTLAEYLESYRDRFDRAVAFRPSGWNYKPPAGRSLETVTVQTVLHSAGSWRSPFTTRDLVPQRGSTRRVRCFGVPYSEHSSFRELTMFCCALRIDKIIPTVNVGSAKGRERMKGWCEKWAADRKKNGLFEPTEEEWRTVVVPNA